MTNLEQVASSSARVAPITPPELVLEARGVRKTYAGPLGSIEVLTDVELAVERWLGAIRPSAIRPEQGAGPAGASTRAEP